MMAKAGNDQFIKNEKNRVGFKFILRENFLTFSRFKVFYYLGTSAKEEKIYHGHF